MIPFFLFSFSELIQFFFGFPKNPKHISYKIIKSSGKCFSFFFGFLFFIIRFCFSYCFFLEGIYHFDISISDERVKPHSSATGYPKKKKRERLTLNGIGRSP